VATFSTGFAQVESVLAEVNWIASDKRTAFQARLKNFQRLGLLENIPEGRGKAATYDAHHVLMLGLAVEFGQLGFAPDTTVSILKRNRAHVVRAIASIPRNEKEAEAWSPQLVYFDPANLSSLMQTPVEELQWQDFAFAPAEEFKEGLRDLLARGCTRLAVINVTGLVVRIAMALERVSELRGLMPGWHYSQALRTWAADEIRAHASAVLNEPSPRRARRWIKKKQR